MKRVGTIDFTRGLVMVIMALDHVREFLHTTALTQSPTDLSTTTPALFLTRWVTHLCAPTFVFLSGTSAYLAARSGGQHPTDRRRFLLTRGLWLLLLELTVINFALWFDLRFRLLVVQVIGAIGAGMMILSWLLRVPPRTVLLLGLLLVFGHDLALLVNVGETTALRFGWSLLFTGGIFPVTERFTFGILYPVLPWLGILLVGFGLGPVFERPLPQRRRTLRRLGVSSLALFGLIRYLNGYGDLISWQEQKNGLFTFFSLLNASKYPPSLSFTLMTLGAMFLILSVADGRENRVTRAISVYGRVPLFYYLVHWYLIHSLMLVMVLLQGYRWAQLPFGPFRFGRPLAPGSGLDLPGVYLVWLAVVAALYPLCRWYGRYKAAHREKWLLRYV